MKHTKWLSQNMNLTEDYVLITGASSGIGLEFLKLFSQEKCNCIIVSNENNELINIAKSLSNTYNNSIVPIYCDFSKLPELSNLITTLKKYKIKVLVNNAGFGIKGEFLEIKEENYVSIINVNVITPTLLMYHLLPKMKEWNSGLVINVASINVVSPIPKNAIYTATKSYLYNASLAIADEVSKYNIMFQTLLPGTTATPFHDKQGAVPKSNSMTPDDVAYRSLMNLDKLVFIPNKIDRWSYPLVAPLPVKIRMKLAKYSLKKRLGV